MGRIKGQKFPNGYGKKKKEKVEEPEEIEEDEEVDEIDDEDEPISDELD